MRTASRFCCDTFNDTANFIGAITVAVAIIAAVTDI
jgi:hypothetical protein